MQLEGKRIGFVFTGSFCTFRKTIEELEKIVKLNANVIPISLTISFKFLKDSLQRIFSSEKTIYNIKKVKAHLPNSTIPLNFKPYKVVKIIEPIIERKYNVVKTML